MHININIFANNEFDNLFDLVNVNSFIEGLWELMLPWPLLVIKYKAISCIGLTFLNYVTSKASSSQ